MGVPHRLATTSIACISSLLLVLGCAKKSPHTVEIGPTDEAPPPAGLPTEEVPAVPTTPDFGSDDTTGTDLPLEDSSPLPDIYFDFDRYDLKPEAVRILKLNAGWLRAHPMQRVLLEGHCDERGTEEYNLALGDRRAQSARRYLIDLGIASNRLTTLSYGESRPQDPRQVEQAWARNRRVHFRILEETIQ